MSEPFEGDIFDNRLLSCEGPPQLTANFSRKLIDSSCLIESKLDIAFAPLVLALYC